MKILYSILFSLALTGLIACGGDSKAPETPAEERAEAADIDVQVNPEEAQRELAEERRQFVDSSRERLAELERDIDQLEQRIDEAGEDVSAETREELRDLRQQRAELSNMLDRAEDETDEEWEQFQSEVDDAFNELEEEYNQALEALQTS